ncbi:hypothetical protein NDU88_006646 [Pleurodeles waltl]|uniref:Uncharacterized protein n=1 Tax=Pleurodeles waltl TaxID=8319 RepID=A0AAV7NQT0_PLEWA|nr:hypothetical protein NDU88_006646 [Pleurodeles waltl]
MVLGRVWTRNSHGRRMLTALQRQIDNGDALESACLEARGRIVELWDRLESYVRRNYRQRLYREGDRSGRMLAWLLRQERPVSIIQMLCGPSGELILGQLRVISHLREHLRVIYTAPCSVDVTRIGEYLDGLQLPRLTEIHSEELEGEVSLDDLTEALGGMVSRKAPGPDGLPVEFYRTYPAAILPRLLETLHEARGAGLLPENMQLIVMLPNPGFAVTIKADSGLSGNFIDAKYPRSLKIPILKKNRGS